MRVSTGMIYDIGVSAIQKKTSSLLTTQQQVSTGRRMLTPSDDPVAAARALEVTQAQNINSSQSKTRDSAKGSLGIVDGQLKAAYDLLGRVRELAVQGANATLSAADRKSAAAELRAHFDELVALANSTDGTGNYLFAGYQTGNKPFAGSVDDGVTYSGDGGLRSLAVSASRNLPISDTGGDIFMGARSGNGVFVTGTPSAKSVIAPPLTLDAGSVTDATAWSTAPAGGIELRFWNDTSGTSYYDLVDVASGDSLFTGTPSSTATTYTHAYTDGAPIALSSTSAPAFDFGAAVTASGTPANGDTFSITRTLAGGILTSAVSVHQVPVIDQGAVTDPIKWSNAGNSGNLEVRFWIDSANVLGGGANATYYDLVDAASGKSLFSGAASATGAGGSYTHAYTSGNPIAFSGLAAAYNPPSQDFGATVTVTGTPASGDAFTVNSGTAATGNGYFVTAPKMAATYNGGGGVIGAGAVLDQAKWNNPANSRNVEIRFFQDNSISPAALNYDLVDVETEKSLFTDSVSVAGGTGNTFTHRFTAGDSIPFTGLHVADPANPSVFYDDFGIAVTINGTPRSGDAFTLQASSSQSIFATFADLVRALETGNPAGTSGNTQLANAVSAVLTNLSQAEDSLLRVRASVGTGLAELDNLDSVGDGLKLQYAQTLSNLQDVDYASAITNLTRQQVELQAAQQSFAKISQLSLFNYL